MTIARRELIDPAVARWYHCVSRCVRGALLLANGKSDRKEQLENRIEELSQIFAVAVGGYSVMSTHLHMLLRLDHFTKSSSLPVRKLWLSDSSPAQEAISGRLAAARP